MKDLRFKPAFPRASGAAFVLAACFATALSIATPSPARAGDCQGQGTATLALAGDVPPAVATVFGLEITGRPFAPFALLADTGNGPVEVPSIGTVCLDLGPQLRVIFDGLRTGTPFLGATGMFSTALRVPNRPAAAGRTFFMQAIVQDPTAPMGFATSDPLEFTILPSLIETFATTDQRISQNTSAIWEGDGQLVGIPISPPRFVEFTPFASIFNLPHPLVETTNPTTTGARFQMLYFSGDLDTAPGESIHGIDWGPKSNFTFASDYDDVRIRLGHLPRVGFPGGLSPLFEDNLDSIDEGNPETVFEGSYEIVNGLEVEWEPWPAFTKPFDYEVFRNLVFEWDMPAGGDTYQLFRNNSTASFPQRRAFGDGGSAQAAFFRENTTYHTRFLLVQDRGVALSNWYDTNEDDPDYATPYVKLGSLPEGTSVEFEYKGAMDINGDDIPDLETGFSSDINVADGHRFIRFRATLRASEADDVAAIKALVIPYGRN